jgi:phosphoesterase RecJ-like protein
MKETVRNIVDAIRSGNSFLITTHESPDGDAVGSALGMACFLRAIGKHVCVHLCDPVPETYEFLPGADLVQRHIPDQAFDVSFVLDIGELKRAGAEFCSFNLKGRLNTWTSSDL